MRRRRALAGLLLFAPVAFVAAQTPAPSPVAVPTFRVVYFEVAPSEVSRAIALLRTYLRPYRATLTTVASPS